MSRGVVHESDFMHIDTADGLLDEQMTSVLEQMDFIIEYVRSATAWC